MSLSPLLLCVHRGDPRCQDQQQMATAPAANRPGKQSAAPSRAIMQSDSFKAVFYSVLLALQFGFQACPRPFHQYPNTQKKREASGYPICFS